MGKQIYCTEDEFGQIVVTERGNKRVLSFDSGLQQSSVLISKPYCLTHEYTQIMLLGLLLVEAKQVTILGLGGGGLAHTLSHYYPQLNIQAVELRQTVIDVAYNWFNLPKVPHLRVHCSEALLYLQNQSAAQTDLILSDLYDAAGMSEVQGQLSFIESSHRVLSAQGVLVLNFHELPAEDSSIMKKIRQLFAEVLVCDVFTGNWVMFCCKRAAVFSQNELNQRVRSLAKKVEIPLVYYYKQLRELD